jgi:hypothetical protein
MVQLVLAGRLLARWGRKEVLSCIAGLRQIGVAFEIGFDYAEELEALYARHAGAVRGDDATLDEIHLSYNGSLAPSGNGSGPASLAQQGEGQVHYGGEISQQPPQAPIHGVQQAGLVGHWDQRQREGWQSAPAPIRRNASNNGSTAHVSPCLM